MGSVLNGVKMLLKQAYRDGLHQSTDFQHRDFKKIEEEVDTIYLTNDEIRTLYDLDLTKDIRLDRIRDLFVIGCYTGLRFSDYSQLRPLNVISNEDGYALKVTTQKTAARVVIPLNPTVLTILEKYDGVPPRVMSNQKFNQYLKELGQLAGLTTPVGCSQCRVSISGSLATGCRPQRLDFLLARRVAADRPTAPKIRV